MAVSESAPYLLATFFYFWRSTVGQKATLATVQKMAEVISIVDIQNWCRGATRDPDSMFLHAYF